MTVPQSDHPVRDIVLPLAVVIGLVANALMIGIAWGRFGQRLDTYDRGQEVHGELLKSLTEQVSTLRDRVRDLERDALEDRKDFQQLENYTRGRIDHMPWRRPSSQRE